MSLGSKAFHERNKTSLNSFNNADAARLWTPDQRYQLEVFDALKRQRVDLEGGILAKYKALRERQLMGVIAENCYKDKSLTFLEAEMCEDFHFKNDYKMKQIDSFWQDHISKHVLAYRQCSDSVGEMPAEATVLEKEKAFGACHDSWLRDFKDNTTIELEGRARQLLGKNIA